MPQSVGEANIVKLMLEQAGLQDEAEVVKAALAQTSNLTPAPPPAAARYYTPSCDTFGRHKEQDELLSCNLGKIAKPLDRD